MTGLLPDPKNGDTVCGPDDRKAFGGCRKKAARKAVDNVRGIGIERVISAFVIISQWSPPRGRGAISFICGLDSIMSKRLSKIKNDVKYFNADGSLRCSFNQCYTKFVERKESKRLCPTWYGGNEIEAVQVFHQCIECGAKIYSKDDLRKTNDNYRKTAERLRKKRKSKK